MPARILVVDNEKSIRLTLSEFRKRLNNRLPVSGRSRVVEILTPDLCLVYVLGQELFQLAAVTIDERKPVE